MIEFALHQMMVKHNCPEKYNLNIRKEAEVG